MKYIFIRTEPLATRVASNPIAWAYGLFIGGSLLGLLVASVLHWAWINTVYREKIEIEYAKKLVYHVGDQAKCVAKWKKEKLCVDWH
jgi:hypothetical protein